MRELMDRAAAASARWGRSWYSVAGPRLPRTRRTLDATALGAAAAGLVGVTVGVALDPPRSMWSLTLVPRVGSQVARTAVAVVNVGLSLVVVALLVLLAVDALRRRRRFALVASVLSCVLGVLLAFAVAGLTGLLSSGAFGVLLGRLDDSGGLPVIAAVALALGMGPQRGRPARLLALALAGSIVCALALGGLTVLSAIYALLVAMTAAFAVRVVLGVAPERPTEAAIRQALADAGWPTNQLCASREAAGRIRYAAVLATGTVVGDSGRPGPARSALVAARRGDACGCVRRRSVIRPSPGAVSSSGRR